MGERRWVTAMANFKIRYDFLNKNKDMNNNNSNFLATYFKIKISADMNLWFIVLAITNNWY